MKDDKAVIALARALCPQSLSNLLDFAVWRIMDHADALTADQARVRGWYGACNDHGYLGTEV